MTEQSPNSRSASGSYRDSSGEPKDTTAKLTAIGESHVEGFGSRRSERSENAAFCYVIDKKNEFEVTLNVGQAQGVFPGAVFDIFQNDYPWEIPAANLLLQDTNPVAQIEIQKSELFESFGNRISFEKPFRERRTYRAYMRTWALPEIMLVQLDFQESRFREHFREELEKTPNLRLYGDGEGMDELSVGKVIFEVSGGESTFQVRQPGQAPIPRLPTITQQTRDAPKKLADVVRHLTRYKTLESYFLNLRQQNSSNISLDMKFDGLELSCDENGVQYASVQNGDAWKVTLDVKAERSETPLWLVLLGWDESWGIKKLRPYDKDAHIVDYGDIEEFFVSTCPGGSELQDMGECVDKCLVVIFESKSPPSWDLLTLPSLLPDPYDDEERLNTQDGSAWRHNKVKSLMSMAGYAVPSALWIQYFEIRISPVSALQAENDRTLESFSNLILIEESNKKLEAESKSPVEEATKSQTSASQTSDMESDLPEARTREGPINVEHGTIDLSEEQEAARSSYHPWIASMWYWLTRILDPPPEGAYRATYTCECGELCYVDLRDLVPGGAAELEQEIRKKAGLVRCRNRNNSTASNNNIQAPAPTHSNNSNPSHNGGQTAPIHGLPTMSTPSQDPNIANVTAQASVSGEPDTAPKYLLLCVNMKHGLVKHVNVDVSNFRDDEKLFQQIGNAYKTARQGHDWDLATLVPGKGKIPNWMLAKVPMRISRNIEFPQRIAEALHDFRLFIPWKIEFVKFELMPVQKEICAGNFEKPQIPGVEEVKTKKTYVYWPTDRKAEFLTVPIHHLLKPGDHGDVPYWLKIFPKKLDSPLEYCAGHSCYGWGILINEGWNTTLVFALCFLAMVIFGIFVILYSVFTNDASTGAGIGSFLMAMLTLYYTLEYNLWKER